MKVMQHLFEQIALFLTRMIINVRIYLFLTFKLYLYYMSNSELL